MSDIAIQVTGLTKIYRLGKQESYRTLRDTISNAATAPFRRLSGRPAGQSRRAKEQLSALDDVSFEVKRGEVIGIIGGNGAGKSTLLKILARITEPTSGTAEIRGRVGSLLEVGTGFHPELTGRENIYLNGAILGMKRVEIDRKFDEIVAFAEVDRFIDTVVKHYSSGMYLRLAFSVAAHLEPEILLVDEVLAVGDASFQNKCIGKMGAVATQGRTILFVSHNMEAVARLCARTVLLEHGKVSDYGPTDSVIESYLRRYVKSTGATVYQPTDSTEFSFLAVYVGTDQTLHSGVISINAPLRVTIDYRVHRTLSNVQIVFHIYNGYGVHVLSSADHDTIGEIPVRPRGDYRAVLSLPPNLLAPGPYRITVACGIPDVRVISILDGPTFDARAENSEFSSRSSGRRRTILSLAVPWLTETNHDSDFKFAETAISQPDLTR